MLNDDFAEKFAKLRKSRRMTQQTVAEALHISNRAVSKWENKLALPSPDNIARLAKLFGISVDYFFESDGKQNTADTEESPASSVSDSPVLSHADEKKPLGMQSLTALYRIGVGPSSSHTMAPALACRAFREQHGEADRFQVILYGSLAKIGKSYGIENIIKNEMSPLPCEILFNLSDTDLPHVNTLDLIAYRNGRQTERVRAFSTGGGQIVCDSLNIEDTRIVYPLADFNDITAVCRRENIRLWQYVERYEGGQIWTYLAKIWQCMKDSMEAGLADSGTLPGGLNVQKKARHLLEQDYFDEPSETHENRLVCAYAFAVGEQNADAKKIVTAPTCGSAGVLPAVLYYYQKKRHFSDAEILHALATGGIIGNLIKTNASISGSECGCQAEIGTACAMAAAALGELFGLNLAKIECAAEIAVEHHLGLTCDPICGLVQIPCIERNAVAAMRAINAVSLASFLSDSRKISFDEVIEVMKKTGRDLSKKYKETAEGGLATLHVQISR